MSDAQADNKKRRYTKREQREGTLALLRAILGNFTPCNACVYNQRCETMLSACPDWGHYVRTGNIRIKDRSPSSQLLPKIDRS